MLRKFLRCFVVGLVFLVQISCIRHFQKNQNPPSELRSEVDSFTPRIQPIEGPAIGEALKNLDDVTNTYLQEAIDWANSEPECSSRCMAMLVSETLAQSQSRSAVENKLSDLRAGNPYKRWGYIPAVPGWRGFSGEIEHLVSKGQTQDGRYSLNQGVIRLPLGESVFRGIGRFDSPGSFLEVGAILPVDLGKKGPRVYIGSDKFGHFLSTGFEYLEAYLETYDQTITGGLNPEEAHERAEFAMYVRGLLTEATSLGGWIARVFSFGDLAANHAGYLFFKDIFDQKSPYLSQDNRSKKWRLSSRRFTWRDFIEASWDEAINCSHYFNSVGGSNEFQKKVVRELIDLTKKYSQRFVCPVDISLCKRSIHTDEARFGKNSLPAIMSRQCRDLLEPGKMPIEFIEADLQKDPQGFNEMGFYTGEKVVEEASAWCAERREALVRKRCLAHPMSGVSAASCVKIIPRVTSEKFRCAMDMRDFLGWVF